MCMWLLDTEVVITDEEAMVTAGAELMGGMDADPTVVGPGWAPGWCGPGWCGSAPGSAPPWPMRGGIPMGEDRALLELLRWPDGWLWGWPGGRPGAPGVVECGPGCTPGCCGCPLEAITDEDAPFGFDECGDRTVSESVLGEASGELDTTGCR